jgi:hypothetical protein
MKKIVKKGKKKLASIASLKKKAQSLFNGFIRRRDSNEDGSFVCISCQQEYTKDKCQAGHFFGTKKYNWMRFLEDNCNAQCNYCNGFNHESLIGYTLNIQKKIGPKRFNELLMISKERKEDFKRDELTQIIEKYEKKMHTNSI